MDYKLREYQQQAVDKGIDFFLSDTTRNVIEVLPTGSGKSLVVANIAKSLPGNTIIFQPSKELLKQNYDKFISYGESAEIYSASMNQKTIGKVTFATIGSIVNKTHLFEDFQHCIIDECHLVSPDEGSMYKRFLNSLNVKILGLTATPIRMKRYSFPVPHTKLCMLDRMRPRVFQEYLHITQIQEMIEHKYFADIEYCDYDFDESKLKINSTGGDYTENSITQSIHTNFTLEKIQKLFNELKSTVKHILIFVESIETALSLQSILGQNQCGLVTGTTNKKERENTLNNFKNGKTFAVVNVGVLTTGFDFPELDCIISARPTMSLGLYYQIIGRCVRPHPNKLKAYVHDFAGNFKRFGKISDLIIEEKQGKWIIHNGKKVLTNTDITGNERDGQIGVALSDAPIMTFGKYKGQPLEKIPNYYLTWLYKNVKRNKYKEFIFKYIEENILIGETN